MPASADIANQITAYDANKVTSTDALNKALAQFGVPEIRNTVSGLRTTLANTQSAYNNVDPSVTGRTQGSLVTEAQRQKQVSNERAPIAGQISDQSKALNDNQTALTDANSQATTLATNQVNDYNAGRAALQSQYDTTYAREQDTAKAEAARQAAAQAQANEDRNYSLSASKASTGTKASVGDTKAAVQQHVTQGLASSVGKDGHVSEETWAAALNDYQAAGLGNVRQFWQQYGRYVNGKYGNTYAGYAQR